VLRQFQPNLVVIDPVTNLTAAGDPTEVKAMLMRLLDFLKSQQITTVFTSLTGGGDALEQTEAGISSLMDTWLLLRFIESGGERNRGLYVLKSRGMAHSNQVREFLLTDHGIELVDVYVGPSGVLTGAARHAQEAREQAEEQARREEVERRQRELERKRQAMDAQIEALRAAFAEEEEEIQRVVRQGERREALLLDERRQLARLRQADIAPTASGESGTTNGGAE
jgi:circadian clock protein KaiC